MTQANPAERAYKLLYWYATVSYYPKLYGIVQLCIILSQAS